MSTLFGIDRSIGLTFSSAWSATLALLRGRADMAIGRLDSEVDVRANSGAPLSIADIAEVELAFKRRPMSSGWSGYGFVRDRASGPSAIVLFFSGDTAERLHLSRGVNGSYRLTRDGTGDQFALNELKGLNRLLAWLATRG